MKLLLAFLTGCGVGRLLSTRPPAPVIKVTRIAPDPAPGVRMLKPATLASERASDWGNRVPRSVWTDPDDWS